MSSKEEFTFKETEIGSIPDDWEVIQLGDVADYINGYAFKPSQWNKKGLPIIRIQNLTQSTNKINYFDGIIDKKYKVKNGDILISWSASLGVFKWDRGDAWLNQHIFKVDNYLENIWKEYLRYVVMTKIESMKTKTHGSTMHHITKKEFLAVEIPLPHPPEQHRIAAVLSAVQDAKEKTGAVIAAAKSLKKSLMRHLFTYGPVPAGVAEGVSLVETEIGLVPEGWEVVRLGGHCNFTTGKLNSNQAVINGKYPFFTCSQETYRISKYSFNCEAVLLSGNNARGIYSVKYYNGKFDAYQRTYIIIIKDNHYLDYYYLRDVIETKLEELRVGSIGTSTKFLTLKMLLNLEIPLPPLPTQQKIAHILSTVDKKIEAEENKKKALDELFKSLLHNLMTGKIRVNHLEVGK